MPATPDPELAAKLAKQALDIYSSATADMLEVVAKRVAQGIDEPGWAEAKLANLTGLRAAVQKRLVELNVESAGAVAEALTEATQAGAARATAELGGTFAKSNPLTLEALIRETVLGLQSTQPFILRAVDDSYRSIIADATSGVATGTTTRRQATAKALDRFAAAGIKGFRDSAGRQWEIETYAEMAVRTASGRAAVDGALDRYQSKGHDLVFVSNAPEECPICRPWEGKVLSISGNTTGKVDGVTIAGSVASARAGGLQHANCRHSLSLYVPGLSAPQADEDPEGNKLRQQQRALERNVREAKRRVVAHQAFVEGLKSTPDGIDPDSAATLKKLKERQRATQDRLKTFIDDNDRKSLPYRTAVRPSPS